MQFDVGAEVFISRSLVKLGASDNGKNAVKRTQNTIAFAPLLYPTYEAFGIWLQIGLKWNIFSLKMFSCKCSVFVIVCGCTCVIKASFKFEWKTGQSGALIPLQTFKKPWNCLKSAALTFHVVTRSWWQIKELVPCYIAKEKTIKHWRHFQNATSFQLMFGKGNNEWVLACVQVHNEPWFHTFPASLLLHTKICQIIFDFMRIFRMCLALMLPASVQTVWTQQG